MEYDEEEKIVDELECELDSIYNMIFLIHEYGNYKDIVSERYLTEKRYKSVVEKQKQISEQICDNLRRYRNCKKKSVSNNYYVSDRSLMEKKITDIYFMFMQNLV